MFGRSVRPLFAAVLLMAVLPVVVATGTLAATSPAAAARATSIDTASAGTVAGEPASTSSAPSAAGVTPEAATPLPNVPQGWPSTHLEVGLTDSPGGAAALHAKGPYKFRYQYLAGGVNTGKGWSTWNSPSGAFADLYVNESVAVGITPVFIYYQLLQSSPAGGDEGTADRSNLKNTSTMSSYWADFTLLMKHLGAYSQKIVVDVEPDLWGYIQQASTGDNGASIAAAVASSGNADLAASPSLPNNAAGFAQAFVRLRDKYAPNVMLGYELSMWGTMTDPLRQNIPLDQIDALAARSTAFQKSLGASFDLVFTDPADRDADFDKIIYGDGGVSWWDATDYQRFDQYVGDFVRGVGLRMVLWQIPLGNTKMAAVNNTWGHYKDNHVEWWFDDATGAHLASTLSSGVVAMLFGGGADGTTSASGDGGYFYARTAAYYTAGALPLPGLDWTVSAAAGSPVVVRGRSEAITATVAANVTATVRVDIELHGPDGSLVTSWSYANTSFTPGQSLDFPITWASGAGNAPGTYTVQAGVSDAGGQPLSWNTRAATFSLMIAGTYVPLPPTRLLDSRDGTGGLSGAFSARIARTFGVGGRVVGSVQVPSNALAVTGNLTVTEQTARGYLYIGPVAMDNPTSSTLNFPVNDDRANAVTVALGAGGSLSITYAAPYGTRAHVIFDITGYYTPDSSGSTYVPLPPVRLLDTRDGTGGLSGALPARQARTFAVRNHVGVPGNATAVTGNLTVTQQTANGYLYIGPVAMDNPTSSTLNFPVNDDRANAVTVVLATDGSLSVTFAASHGTAHVVFDVTGYYVPDATGSVYVALPPTRVLDTRYGTGLVGVFSGRVARQFQMGGQGGVPSSATAVTGNLTVTEQTKNGFLFIGPVAMDNPTSSTLNFPINDDRANAVSVALAGDGRLSVTYAAPKGATAQVIFDVTGYFLK